jgi:hypothetical protein
MTSEERQQLMNQFQEFLKTDFLPNEQKFERKKWSQPEWENHFNGLSQAFANFVFWPRTTLLPQYTKAFIHAYGEFVKAMLEQRAIEYEWEDRSAETMEAQQQYYCWPVCMFMSERQLATPTN